MLYDGLHVGPLPLDDENDGFAPVINSPTF